jgi:hypothetical protein
VIAAFDDGVGILAGEGARETQRSHHRFGTGIREAHALRRRHHLADTLGDHVLALRRERKHPADFDAGARRRVHARIGVTENAGAVGHAIVDVFVVVDVPDPGAARLADIERLILAPVAEIRRNTERQFRHCALEMSIASGE